jgi:hypothetical protein
MKRLRLIIIVALVAIVFAGMIGTLVGAGQSTEPLSGNWLCVPTTRTARSHYLSEPEARGQKITGTIRVTQFFYRISESTPGDDGRMP